MASGSGISGSTAWHGAFRFRQYLKGIKEEDDGDRRADDLRELEFKKNQYGPKGRPIMLRYKDGLFIPVNGATDPERLAREARADGCSSSYCGGSMSGWTGSRIWHHHPIITRQRYSRMSRKPNNKGSERRNWRRQCGG